MNARAGVVGRGGKSQLSGPGSELRVGKEIERKKKGVKMMDGMSKIINIYDVLVPTFFLFSFSFIPFNILALLSYSLPGVTQSRGRVLRWRCTTFFFLRFLNLGT